MVTPRGSEAVVSGSTIASRGRSAGWLMPVFTRSAWTPTTQTGVLSAPVPAVVGHRDQRVQRPRRGAPGTDRRD